MAHGFALESERRRASGEAALELSVIGNTGDDLELHGLHISPDLDTVMYTLAGLANPETGWGVRDETWSASEMLMRYGQPTWFGLGDGDLATHIVRTARLTAGDRLTTITLALSASLGVRARLLPVSDDRLRTMVRTADGWLDFQDYFVRRHHADEVLEVRFDGADEARATSEVIQAVGAADLLVIAPSNPFVSVAPLLALPELLQAIHVSDAPVLGVSPIVDRAALRGPAGAMLASQGLEVSSAGIATFYSRRYPGLLDVLAIDAADAADAAVIEQAGMRVLVTQTVMTEEADRCRLAQILVEAAETEGWPVGGRGHGQNATG